MSGITSGTGIFSGINTASLIEQLIAAQSTPRTLAQRRLIQLQGQQAAMLDINSRLSALKTAASKFNTARIFETANAQSSNANALSASASPGATPGTYSFIVDRIVSSQQLLSRGFADRNSTSLGASEFIFESALGRIDRDTSLSDLNGGNGIARGRIVITDSSGASATVDLSRVGTVNEVLDAINSTSGISISARIEGNRFVLSDSAGGTGKLRVANTFGSTTATSLGIEGEAALAGSSGVIQGSGVYGLGESTTLQSLNDGNGIRFNTAAGTSTPDFTITDRSGTVHTIDIGDIYDSSGAKTASAVSNIRGLIERVNQQTGGAVTVSIMGDGSGLRLTDNTGSTAGNLIVSDLGSSTAATDLGLIANSASATFDGKRVIAGLNTTLAKNLLGGAGLAGDSLFFTARDGSAHSVTLPIDGSVSDMIEAVRTQTGGKLTLSLDDTGTGFVLNDTTGGFGNLQVSGSAALQLGFSTPLGGVAESSLKGNRLQHKYIAESTQLSSLNGGAGIGTGTFEIIDSGGRAKPIVIGESIRTIGQVIEAINSGSGFSVRARINDNGDGIVLEEDPPGAGGIRMSVRDVSGTVARNLNLVGTAAGTGTDNVINGSFERRVAFTAADTLDTVISKINQANVGVTASVINDGTGANPFRISLTSKLSGEAGRFTLDTGGFDLGARLTSLGQNSRIFYGSNDAASGVLLSSTTNTFDGVIANVKLDAKAADANPVTITISRDSAAVEAAVGDFISAFNDVVSRIDTLTKYDPETQRKGTLLGDSTVVQLRQQLFNTLQRRAIGVSGEFQFFAQIGVKIGQGGQLSLDADALRAALAQDPLAVAELFAAKVQDTSTSSSTIPGIPGASVVGATNSTPVFTSLGIAEQLAQLADVYLNSTNGVLKRRGDTFNDQIKLQNDRIARFDVQLQSKREILRRQFQAMEAAIGKLQSQQGSIGQLSQLVGR